MVDSDAFEDAMVDFAVAYADQAERDHQALAAAVRSGRVEVAMAFRHPVIGRRPPTPASGSASPSAILPKLHSASTGLLQTG